VSRTAADEHINEAVGEVMSTNLIELSRQVDSLESLAKFVAALQADLLARPDEWENADLARYLEAMSGWIADMDGYYRNSGEPFDGSPSWSIFADMLLAAKIYE